MAAAGTPPSLSGSRPPPDSRSSPSSSPPTRHGGLKSLWWRRRRKAALTAQEWRCLFTSEGKFHDGGVKLLKKIRSGVRALNRASDHKSGHFFWQFTALTVQKLKEKRLRPIAGRDTTIEETLLAKICVQQ